MPSPQFWHNAKTVDAYSCWPPCSHGILLLAESLHRLLTTVDSSHLPCLRHRIRGARSTGRISVYFAPHSRRADSTQEFSSPEVSRSGLTFPSPLDYTSGFCALLFDMDLQHIPTTIGTLFTSSRSLFHNKSIDRVHRFHFDPWIRHSLR
ncbi:Hypothetical predicted protein [Octopus vulgaris]|uniref:Uncharacterized protein n=1 Tax=Octopus vulgaris TaxID=6645 RepID=A0AA36B9U2_OCTVU|nr:Hypothetical predicted protein [Octopus vulgaris]